MNDNEIQSLDWVFPMPFVKKWKVDTTHIDHYGHVNNVTYLSRLEKLAWEHSTSLGLSFDDYKPLNRAMVIQKHELNYHKPLYCDDDVVCATWIIKCDFKFKLERFFQYIRLNDQATVFTANTHFVCCALDSGRPKRMPIAFTSIYGDACIQKTSFDAKTLDVEG